MKFEVNTELLNGLTLEEFLILWASVNKGTPSNHVYLSLGAKGFGTPLFNSESVSCSFLPNSAAKDYVNRVLVQSTINEDKRDLTELAKALKDIFPKGKKDGTGVPWADGTALIEKRLKRFFKKYGEFPFEDIINATRKYVEGFNGNYRLMRTLRYFIWKEERGAGDEVESKSDLLTYLENIGDEEDLRNDWTTELR